MAKMVGTLRRGVQRRVQRRNERCRTIFRDDSALHAR
jgi:hypothetical protein